MTEETLPAIVPETDPSQAFEEVRRELSMLESAIKGLAAERKNAPDYSVTLGEMAEGLEAINVRLHHIEHSKVLALSPVELAKEIDAAAETVRSQDRRLLDEVRRLFKRHLADGGVQHCPCSDPNCPTFVVHPRAAHDLDRARSVALGSFAKLCPGFDVRLS